MVDNALKARAAAGSSVRFGMAGAGFMGRGITADPSHLCQSGRVDVLIDRLRAAQDLHFFGSTPITASA